MSRTSPVPKVVITPTITTDSDTGINDISILIDIQIAPDLSNGFVVLDDPEDLYILRDAIDKYISTNNIKKSTSMNTDNTTPDKTSTADTPRFLGVIDGYINSEWRPARGYNPDDRRNFCIKTSQEIILDLADMVDIELNDVAAAMMHLGYRTIIIEGKAGWLLQRRPRVD